MTKNVNREGDEMVVTWSSLEGGHYRIETSTDLENWTEQDEFVAESNRVEGVAELGGGGIQFSRLIFTGEIEEFDSEGAGSAAPGGGMDPPPFGGPPPRR